ncbi:TIR domain-containing protein [Desulfocicer vacuolatum DSM 3385]|uniref:TIR domain-containing protein n=1 Tax=Desulfocicer vacuolatum DSM 3385 TaxID=1121400 RepID=A0A1W2DQH9_9BACT|nr:toll/interleukin-1 receptor domain-containing protein [Desulfocicer vacuolatum]SMC99659.1 TIR domain-containing protein [Desulfocicer vacuolatum DSM 3385]
MSTAYKYDVFISYSHKDRLWVTKELLPKLEQHRFKIFIDFRDFQSGRFSVTEMERGVNSSKRVLLVLTDDYIKSDWGTFENVMGQTTDPAAINRKRIPVLRGSCDIPLRLQIIHYRDLRNNDSQQWDLLIRDLI